MQRTSVGTELLQVPDKLYIITIIYNSRVEDIRSLDVFLSFKEKYPDTVIMAVDNSVDEAILKSNSACTLPVEYIPCGGNVGISKAYNIALNTIKDENFRVMLSDDDTLFSEEYLENMYKAAQLAENKDRLICGLIDTDKGWMSPRSVKTTNAAFPFMLKKPVPGVYKDRNPVNSGLCIPGFLLHKIGGYDERLFLDYVDYLFMDKIRDIGYGEVVLVPGKIHQEFSGFSDNLDSTLKRWEIFRKDFTAYCDITKKSWAYKNYLLARRSLNINAQKILKRNKS